MSGQHSTNQASRRNIRRQNTQEDAKSEEDIKFNLDPFKPNPDTNQETNANNEAIDYQKCIAWMKLNIFQIIVSVCLVIFCIWLIGLSVPIKKNSQQKSVTPAPPQFHHSFFDLITEGYTELENLKWKEDDDQQIGDIKLLKKTHILISQDGFYHINCIVQLKINESISQYITVKVHKKKNGEKDHILTKESTHSLNISEYSTMYLPFTAKLQTNDTICFEMQGAEFIIKDDKRSYLYIYSLYLDNPPKHKP